MRSMWKGSVSFGLVSIPVKMYLATDQHDVSFRQVRSSDGSRVRYKRVAEADGEEVAYSDIAKGYELSDGSMVVLTDEDFADLPLPTKKVIEVLQFVPLDQVDPIYFNKTYYLEPENNASLKPYVLLRDALEGTDMVAIVKITISTREQIAALRVRDDVVVVSTMLWPDEIRPAEFGFLDQDVSVRPQEQSMADSLVSSMAGDFDAEDYHDDFADALKQVIDAKLEGGDVTQAPTKPEADDNVVDIMSALQASIDRAKDKRGGSATDTSESGPKGSTAKKSASKTSTTKKAAKKAPAKKSSAAKKSAAKKSATKKTAAKKTAANKTAAKKSA